VSQNPFTVVGVADLHCGSQTSICLPKNAQGSGLYEASKAQLALYEGWRQLSQDWHEPDVLVVDGDAIEGKARKESGAGTWTTSLIEQCVCASALIGMFKPKAIYIIRGSGYHVDSNGDSFEEVMAGLMIRGHEEPGIPKMPVKRCGEHGHLSADELFLRVRGATTFHFAHQLPTGTSWYRTTPLAKEMALALYNASHKYKANITVRAHCHFHVAVEFTSQKGYILPCWQWQTPYMLRKSAWMVPDIGALRWTLDEGGPDNVKVEKRFLAHDAGKPRLITVE
jgi:hypothetical protein